MMVRKPPEAEPRGPKREPKPVPARADTHVAKALARKVVAQERARGAQGRAGTDFAQAWIEPLADDPEAVSALEVARARLAAGRRLNALRRMRVFEISGALPGRAALEGLLHRSIQFYNPAKERCTLRVASREAPPLAASEVGVLVLERGSERRGAAERWWRHETGTPAEIREGVAWALEFAPGTKAGESAADLAILRDRHHGLLCNPHWQDARIATGEIPLPWLAEATPVPVTRTRAKTARPKVGRAASKGSKHAATGRERRRER
jgi:hypothetical protein